VSIARERTPTDTPTLCETGGVARDSGTNADFRRQTIEADKVLAARLAAFYAGEEDEVEVLSEIIDRYWLLWKKKATIHCGRLAHRGASCAARTKPGLPWWAIERAGGAEQTRREDPEWDDPERFAYKSIIESYRDKVLGRPKSEEHRSLQPLLMQWAEGAERSFSAYFNDNSVSGNEEALRQWNSGRGLPVRFASPEKVMAELRQPMEVIWSAVVDPLLVESAFEQVRWPSGSVMDKDVFVALLSKMREGTPTLGLDRSDGWWLLARSLWWDVSQAPARDVDGSPRPFDEERIARHLNWSIKSQEDPSVEAIRATRELVLVFEALAEIVSHLWWAEWIARPRAMTANSMSILSRNDGLENEAVTDVR
jgi:hypothetical protein